MSGLIMVFGRGEFLLFLSRYQPKEKQHNIGMLWTTSTIISKLTPLKMLVQHN